MSDTGFQPPQQQDFSQTGFQEQFNILLNDINTMKQNLLNAQWQISLATDVLKKAELSRDYWQGGQDTGVSSGINNDNPPSLVDSSPSSRIKAFSHRTNRESPYSRMTLGHSETALCRQRHSWTRPATSLTNLTSGPASGRAAFRLLAPSNRVASSRVASKIRQECRMITDSVV